ncbi:RHS repeat-associated core domain-containing protein [Agromyces silvae]|uniref:RHS repeat-associated core domain-containing protein n=1 Tax=Agromyces silvae TaxID=3388266 RepID=UPI00280C1A71|nr:RHS repeat-associated core domain-containing protein [Agromyces protaetiae]
MARAGQSRVERGCGIESGGRAGWAIAIGSVLCVGLVGGLVSPGWAVEPPGGGAGGVELGSFALGDALEGTIGELDGSFGFGLSAGGVQLGWDSRAAAVDAVGLGGGWSFGLATVRVVGGVWVYPASGGAFAMNASVPSGLDGYSGVDVVFRAAVPGAVVPARADGSVGETPYAFVLHELGGVSTYFDAAGLPVTHTTGEGVRIGTRYWADGSRREHTTESGSTRYYWDGDRLLNDVHDTADGAHGTASYLIGATRHTRSIRPADDAASTSYYGTDRHGNITDLTDHTGTVTTSYAYTDYGIATVTGDQPDQLPAGIGELGHNPFQYAGEYTYRDGSQPLGPRIYDPAQARFTTQDDAPLANLYAYGDLNPITNIDPTGRDAEKDLMHTIVGAVAFGMALFGGLAMVMTPGILFNVFGFIGVAIAFGDTLLAAIQAIEASQRIDIAKDDRAIEIASWAFAAASVVVGFGGAAARWAARGGSKAATTCFELMNCADRLSDGVSSLERRQQQIMRWNTWLANADLDGLAGAAANLTDRATAKTVDNALKHLRFAKSIAATEANTARDFGGNVLEQTRTAVKTVHHSLTYDLKAARVYLSAAETRLRRQARSGLAGTEQARDAFSRVGAMQKEIGGLFAKETTPVPTPAHSSRSSRESSPDRSEASPLLLRSVSPDDSRRPLLDADF